MLNQKVVPLPRPKLLNPAGGNAEQPREFRFAVTWETLLALPQPAEITETIPTAGVVTAIDVTLIDVAAPVVVAPSHALQVVESPPRRPQGDEAAWEMVVPKMVRK